MSNGNDYQKPCKNCKQTITMSQRSGKWSAYEADNSLHRCRDKMAEAVITPQEASHDEPIVLEAKEEMVYPQHRIEIVKSDNLFELQEQVNSILHQNDNKRHNHKGVTILLDDLESHEFSYVAVIHYEILQPREERMK